MDESQTDTGTFEELALPLLARLYNLARWLTQDAGEAEELVQESCMKALRGFGSYRQGTNFSAWIYRIMRNTFLTSRAGLKMCIRDSLWILSAINQPRIPSLN